MHTAPGPPLAKPPPTALSPATAEVAAAGAWLRRHLKLVVASLVLLLLAIGLAVAAAWHFSNQALVPNHSPHTDSVDIEAVYTGRIRLARNEASARPGYYGLAWQAGHAVVGPIVRESDDSITRKLSSVRGYLEPGTEAGLESNVYAGNPREARGLPYREVDVPSELGPMPAWLVPSSSNIWAIVVHGINADRQTGNRLTPALRRAGLPTLVISYRDDLGAPSSPDGLHHMGETEWRDLAAAARYALGHGARRLVLVGYSMGGALITQFMQRSPLAGKVAALVLDAPAIDWKAIFEFNAEQMGLPGFFALPVEGAISARIDPDWDSLDALRHSGSFQLPILLFHGEEDDLIPIATSEDFAAELPDWVTFYRVPYADHTQSWNVGPRRYERRLDAFLGPLFIGTKKRARSRGSSPSK